MSMSFEVFPTKTDIPKSEDVIKYSLELFYEYLHRENINEHIDINISSVSINGDIDKCPYIITSNENSHTVFNINNVGEVIVKCNNVTGIDKVFWDEEIKNNKRALILKDKIELSIKIGHSWNVKRTMGQPAIVSLYYGYLAIAIAVLTDGIIYSDDGAWDYLSFPIEGNSFEKEYLSVDKLTDSTVRQNVENWIALLKNKNG